MSPGLSKTLSNTAICIATYRSAFYLLLQWLVFFLASMAPWSFPDIAFVVIDSSTQTFPLSRPMSKACDHAFVRLSKQVRGLSKSGNAPVQNGASVNHINPGICFDNLPGQRSSSQYRTIPPCHLVLAYPPVSNGFLYHHRSYIDHPSWGFHASLQN